MSRRFKIIFAAGIAALLVVGAGWYGLSHYYLIGTTLSVPLKNGMDYRDPDQYFTIKIPQGWHSRREVSLATAGDRQGSYQLTTIMTTLMPNAPPVAEDPSVFIYLESARDAGAKHWACTTWSGASNTTIAGIPADYNGADQWMVNAKDAHFQIDFSIGKRQSGANFVESTPLPAAEVQSRTNLLKSIIATFRPTPDQPLQC